MRGDAVAPESTPEPRLVVFALCSLYPCGWMARICEVSFEDRHGLKHVAEVSAGSLYEAAVLGLRAFERSELAQPPNRQDSPYRCR